MTSYDYRPGPVTIMDAQGVVVKVVPAEEFLERQRLEEQRNKRRVKRGSSSTKDEA